MFHSDKIRSKEGKLKHLIIADYDLVEVRLITFKVKNRNAFCHPGHLPLYSGRA